MFYYICHVSSLLNIFSTLHKTKKTWRVFFTFLQTIQPFYTLVAQIWSDLILFQKTRASPLTSYTNETNPWIFSFCKLQFLHTNHISNTFIISNVCFQQWINVHFTCSSNFMLMNWRNLGKKTYQRDNFIGFHSCLCF